MSETAKSDNFEVLVRDNEATVDIWYPDFSAERQPYVEIGLVHVRAASADIRVWFDGDANEWVIQVIGEYIDDDEVPERYRQPWVAQEFRVDANAGDLPDEVRGD